MLCSWARFEKQHSNCLAAIQLLFGFELYAIVHRGIL